MVRLRAATAWRLRTEHEPESLGTQTLVPAHRTHPGCMAPTIHSGYTVPTRTHLLPWVAEPAAVCTHMRPFSLLTGKGAHSPAHDTWAHRSPPGAHASHLSNMGDPRSLEGRRNLGTPGPLSAPRAVDRAAKHSKQGLRLSPIAPWIPGSQLSPVSAAFPRRDSVGSGGHVGPVRRTSSGL